MVSCRGMKHRTSMQLGSQSALKMAHSGIQIEVRTPSLLMVMLLLLLLQCHGEPWKISRLWERMALLLGSMCLHLHLQHQRMMLLLLMMLIRMRRQARTLCQRPSCQLHQCPLLLRREGSCIDSRAANSGTRGLPSSSVCIWSHPQLASALLLLLRSLSQSPCSCRFAWTHTRICFLSASGYFARHWAAPPTLESPRPSTAC